MVRRDLISSLPLPRRMIDYLSTPHYYSEDLMDQEIPQITDKTVAVSNPIVIPEPIPIQVGRTVAVRRIPNLDEGSSETPLDSGDEEVAHIGRNLLQISNYIFVENRENSLFSPINI